CRFDAGRGLGPAERAEQPDQQQHRDRERDPGTAAGGQGLGQPGPGRGLGTGRAVGTGRARILGHAVHCTSAPAPGHRRGDDPHLNRWLETTVPTDRHGSVGTVLLAAAHWVAAYASAYSSAILSAPSLRHFFTAASK